MVRTSQQLSCKMYNESPKGKARRYKYAHSEHGKKHVMEYKERNREHLLEKEAERLHKYSITIGKNYKRAIQDWSKIIKGRDNYICMDCGNKENLHAHHILEQKHYPEFAFILSNGITLCKECHWNIHYGVEGLL